ncbi:potassium channel family protein [Streptomyces heilongjiangensis]|uniref:Potassium channel family protein n=1 Tax=Streptomyces heilongjiangensis TaxID=945052 RepID=A0ABW1AZB7_9ACTN|nr:potassium channel family protein [Streptomyces heilongjiangensis]MDC2946418.1 potassium channel family protein [Streptomyces heilongjiangensis]
MSDPSERRAGHGRSRAGGSRRHHDRRARRRANRAVVVRTVLMSAALLTAYYLLPLEEYRVGGAMALIACGLLAIVLLFVWQVRTIVSSPHPRLRAVESLILTVIVFLALFATAYYLMDRATPGSFTEPMTRTDSLYYTLSTFATVGFGDITARSEPGRVATMIQMVVGLLLVGGAARVLTSAAEVGLQRRRGAPPASDGGADAGPEGPERHASGS